MYRGIFSEVTAFSIDVVEGGKQSGTKYESGITERSDPDSVHPGGYS